MYDITQSKSAAVRIYYLKTCVINNKLFFPLFITFCT